MTNLIQQRKAEREARQAEVKRQIRSAAQEDLLIPTFDPPPQTDLEHALAQVIGQSCDDLHDQLTVGHRPPVRIVAARALFAADAVALYDTIRTQAGSTHRDLNAFESQCTMNWLRRELDTAVTRALRTIETIREDAVEHQVLRLHNYLKAERQKRDRYNPSITITDAERAEELGLPKPEPKPGTIMPSTVQAAKVIVVPPPGHPDRERLLAEAMAAREAAEAQ